MSLIPRLRAPSLMQSRIFALASHLSLSVIGWHSLTTAFKMEAVFSSVLSITILLMIELTFNRLLANWKWFFFRLIKSEWLAAYLQKYDLTLTIPNFSPTQASKHFTILGFGLMSALHIATSLSVARSWVLQNSLISSISALLVLDEHWFDKIYFWVLKKFYIEADEHEQGKVFKDSKGKDVWI